MKKTARNVILFDDNEVRKHLMPFTYTRPSALLRVGITTISEKWQSMLGEANYSYLTVPYLKKKFPLQRKFLLQKKVLLKKKLLLQKKLRL